MDNLFVDDIGKRFRIGTAPDKPFRPPQWLNFLRRRKPDGPQEEESADGARDLWALRNVSFRVQPGTVLGIIGANGAGKSTLMKVLARITLPSEGRVVGVGRLVSLLELGAGFDPDLSARENIFLNAALNGVPRADVERRMDAIVEFAEVEQFLSTSLKHFSSGMYLRLAFSIAVNLEPRILLADEILAVGDAGFQERCLQRVQADARQGLTVLFVSHDMEAIARVCNRVIWIDKGKVVKDGLPEDVVADYQTTMWAHADAARSERGRLSNEIAELMSVRLLSKNLQEIGAPPTDESFFIRVRFRTFQRRVRTRCAVDFYAKRVLLFRVSEVQKKEHMGDETYEAAVRVPASLLAETNYSLTVSITVSKHEDREYTLVSYNALSFLAYRSQPGDDGPKHEHAGLLAPKFDWKYYRLRNAPHA
jgi:lipopolysaccharide transport system ATP-binding protein